MGTRGRRIGIEEARGKIGGLALEVAAGAAPVILTRRGEPLAVLVSVHDYNAIKKERERA